MANILEISATANVSELKAGLDQAAASTRNSTGQMSSAFQSLAADSEAATTQISSAFLRSAEASVVAARARDELRTASRQAKVAEDDDAAAIARLALAQKSAAVAATELAATQKAATEALVAEGVAAEAAASANLGFFAKMVVGAKEAALGVRESMHEATASMVESAEAANLAGGKMLTAFSGISKLLGAGIAISFIGHFLDETVQLELELSHLSEATGISMARLSELKSAMAESGAASDRFGVMITRLSKAIDAAAGGSKETSEVFRQLGVDTSSWAGKIPDADSVLMQLADHFHSSSGATQDLGNASRVLGRDIVELKAFLTQGSEAIGEQMARYKDLGEAQERAAESARELRRAEQELKAEWQLFVANILPPLNTGLKYLMAGFQGLKDDIAFVIDVYLGFALANEAAAHAMMGVAEVASGQVKRGMADLKYSVTEAKNAWKFTIDSIKEDAAKGRKAIEDILNPKIETHVEREKPPLPDADKDKRLDDWRAELQAKRDAEDGFHTISKAAEVDFWESKLAIAKNKAETYQAVYHLFREAERAAQRESLDDELKTIEDKVRAERSGSLEKVTILREFLEHMKAMGADQTEEYRRVQSQLVAVTREYQEQQARQTVQAEITKAEATRRGSIERVNAERDVLATMQRLGLQQTTDYQAQVRKLIDASREFNDERRRLAEIGAETERIATEKNFSRERQEISDLAEFRRSQIEYQASAGVISKEAELRQLSELKQEEIRQLTDLENQKYTIEYQAMVRRIALASTDPTKSPTEAARLAQDLLKIQEQHEAQITTLTNAASLDRVKTYQSEMLAVQGVFERLTSGFRSAITSMLNGTKTFTQGMAQMWNSIVTSFVDMLAQMLVKWISHQVALLVVERLFHVRTLASNTGAETVRVAQHAAANTAIVAQDTALATQQTVVETTRSIAHAATNTAMAASDTALTATAVGQQAARIGAAIAADVTIAMSEAAVAGAATLAWWSAVNPLIAPEMAAAQYAIGLGFAGLAAFEKGGIVPQTDLALLHKNEMVLPAPLSQGFQNILNTHQTVGGPSSSRSHVLHFAPTINVHGNSRQTDMRQVLRDHSRELFQRMKGMSTAYNY